MDAANTDQWIARFGAIGAGIVGILTLARRWRRDTISSAKDRMSGESVYVDGTKAALAVLERQIDELRAEIADLRARSEAFRKLELEYIGKITSLEAQNWEQAQEIEDLKARNQEQTEELELLKSRVAEVEKKNGHAVQ